MMKLNFFMKATIKNIDSFTKLEPSWDGYGAIPLCPDACKNAKTILNHVKTIPTDCYPNPHGTLGIEFENEENFLFIEVGENTMTWYTMYYKKEYVEINDDSLDELNKYLMFLMLKRI